MAAARTDALFRQLDAYELGWCLRANRACRVHPVERFFGAISRLGDGLFWYILIGLLPVLYGPSALPVSARMAGSGAAGVVLYKLLKSRMVRQRPFVLHTDIRSATPPLDRYSFPSGHTLHAVSFTVVATAFYPALAWVLTPFAILVAASRVVLGLHYPSDVLAGAGVGVLLAYFAITI